MRVRLSCLLVLTACGGGNPVSPPAPPPPPPPPTAPATVSIQAGQAQQGEPGRPVAIRPAVLVRSASGAALPNVAVTFAIDSGGGSIAAATATSGADGVATAGEWTLGPREGRNTLVATVQNLAPVTFAAEGRFPEVTVIEAQSVAPSGGVLTVQRPAGDPLNGIRVIVPAGAYHTTTQWTVSAKPRFTVPLPDGAFPVGPALTVTNGQAYADSLMGLVIPIRAGADTAVGAFFYEPTTGTLEAIPVAGRTDTSLTIGTRHFSADQLLLPAQAGSTSGALTSSARAPVPFGSVIIVVVGVKSGLLAGTVGSSFQPGVDDWEFVNHGSHPHPGGICAGMTISSLYFNYRHKPGYGPLNGWIDRVPGFSEDNPGGIRFASVVQGRFAGTWATSRYIARLASIATASHYDPDVLHYHSLVVSLHATGRGQLIGFIGSGFGHAVVAYKTSGGVNYFADPNVPGGSRHFDFSASRFVPIPFSAKATASPKTVTQFILIGISAFIPITTIDSDWADLLGGTVGNAIFPIADLEFWDWRTDSWTPIVTDTITVSSDTLIARTNCPKCPFFRREEPATGRQLVQIWDDRGNFLVGDSANGILGATYLLSAGPPRELGFVQKAGANDKGSIQDEYVMFNWIKVRSIQARIAPRGAGFRLDDTVTFVVKHQGTLPATARYEWTISDGSPPDVITKVGDSTASYRFTRREVYGVNVVVKNEAGVILAKDRTTASVRCDSSPVVDARDGRTYSVVCFSNGQAWLAENLQFNAAGSECYDNLEANCLTYGRLYPWSVAMAGATSSLAEPSGVRGACMVGWHLPSPAEWQRLITSFGGATTASPALRAVGFNTFGGVPPTNTSGMAIRGAGLWVPNPVAGLEDEFSGLGVITGLWTSFESAPVGSARAAHAISIGHIPDGAIPLPVRIADGRSVRCVRD